MTARVAIAAAMIKRQGRNVLSSTSALSHRTPMSTTTSCTISSNIPNNQNKQSISTTILLQKESWTSQDWKDARRIMKRGGGIERSTCSWQLLDRAILKEAFHSEEDCHLTAAAASSSSSFLELLSDVIHVWKHDDSSTVMTARQVIQTLESYVAMQPSLFSGPFSNDTTSTMTTDYNYIQLYNTILETAIRRGEPMVHELANDVIQSMLLLKQDGSTVQQSQLRPNSTTFTIAISALAFPGFNMNNLHNSTTSTNNNTLSDAPQRAEALLQQLKNLISSPTTCDTWKVELAPTYKTYSAMISTWANHHSLSTATTFTSTAAAAQRAETLLYESPPPLQVKTYTTVMDLWAKCNQVGAADRCFQLFNHMKELYKTNGDKQSKPNAITYGTVIAAFAKTGRANEAEGVMLELLQEYQRTKDLDLVPNQIHFSALIDAWAKSLQVGAPQRAEALLERMYALAKETNHDHLMPTVITFNSVIHAWAKSNEVDAASRAEAILYRMQSDHVLNVTPDRYTYTTVLDCLANCQSKDAAVRAEAILDLMIEQSSKTDLEVDDSDSDTSSIKPDTITFNTVISAITKSRYPDAVVRALSIFEKMKRLGVPPDRLTFSALISAWANSRDPRAGIEAEKLVNDMKRLYESSGGNPRYQPDTILYTAVIHAWSRCCSNPMAIERARAYLDEMKQSGNSHGRPDVIAYTAFVNLVAKTSVTNKAEVAFEVLSELEELSIVPNHRLYLAILMACAFSNNYPRPARERAFQIAAQVFRQAYFQSPTEKPPMVMYGFFFQAAAGLRHDKEVELVYKLCNKAGFANDKSIQRDLKAAAPHLLYRN